MSNTINVDTNDITSQRNGIQHFPIKLEKCTVIWYAKHVRTNEGEPVELCIK